jgi:hypothetical protein
MRIRNKTKNNLALGFAVVIALSSILVNRVAAADGGLNLPSALVNVVVTNGTESYFNTTLSNVPSGYDVMNETYLGWCIDRTTNMTRNVIFEVALYSSLSPPGNLSSVSWHMVNYILNHKQGNADDVQRAMWYFVNMVGNYTDLTPVAQAIVDDTLANGTGFTPTLGQKVAVICFPIVLFPGLYPVQASIIELSNPIIPEFPTATLPILFALATLSAVIIHKRNLTRRQTQQTTTTPEHLSR